MPEGGAAVPPAPVPGDVAVAPDADPERQEAALDSLNVQNCQKCHNHGGAMWHKIYSLPGEGVEEAYVLFILLLLDWLQFLLQYCTVFLTSLLLSTLTSCRHSLSCFFRSHGPAGRFVKKLGLLGYALFFLIPLTFVALIYAIIPLGNPKISSFREQWVFFLVSNPLVIVLFTFLYTAAFLMTAGRERPFRQHFFPLVFCSATQVALLAPVLLLHGVFDYLGIATYVLFLFSLYVSLKVSYRDLSSEIDSFFRRFVFLIALYVPALVSFLIAYRESGSLLQTLLSLCLAFGTFIYRRIMLSRLDPFPLETAQLLAGLWVQNMSDVMLIFAFPQVDSPGVLVGTFLFNAAGNIGFLGFISNTWIFKIRPNLKNAVVNGIKGKCPLPPAPEPDLSFDPHDRGHSANVNGYRRRQFRFFFFRLLSQSVAMLLYLGISPMLRFGTNRDLTPLSKSGLIVDSDQFSNSMVYAALNLLFVLLVMAFGYQLLRIRHHQSFHELREIHVHDLQNQSRVGLIIAIITHNLVFAIATILSPYCVFAGFKSCVFDAKFDS